MVRSGTWAALLLLLGANAQAQQQLHWKTTKPYPVKRCFYAPGFTLLGALYVKDDTGGNSNGHWTKVSFSGGALGWQKTSGLFTGNKTKQGDPTATVRRWVYSVSWGRIRYAEATSGGGLGKWRLANADPKEGHIMESTGKSRGPIRGTMVASKIGGSYYIYSIGGWEYGGTAGIIDDIFYTRVRSDGKVDNWKQTVDLPAKLMRATAAFAGGDVYVFGGFPSNDFRNNTNTVYCATVKAGGALTKFKSLAKIPKKCGAIAGLVDSTLVYLVGGLTQHDNGFKGYPDVYAAKFSPGCKLGSWKGRNPMPGAAGETPYGVAAGHVYVMAPKENAPIAVYYSKFSGRVSNSLPDEITPPKPDAGVKKDKGTAPKKDKGPSPKKDKGSKPSDSGDPARDTGSSEPDPSGQVEGGCALAGATAAWPAPVLLLVLGWRWRCWGRGKGKGKGRARAGARARAREDKKMDPRKVSFSPGPVCQESKTSMAFKVWFSP